MNEIKEEWHHLFGWHVSEEKLLLWFSVWFDQFDRQHRVQVFIGFFSVHGLY